MTVKSEKLTWTGREQQSSAWSIPCFLERRHRGYSQPWAGFYSTLVLISLRLHGGEADLIIVMVADGSKWLATSPVSTETYPRLPKRVPCCSTRLPRALACPLLLPLLTVLAWIPSYRTNEMQVHRETREPVRFKLQNFFSKDNTIKRRASGGCTVELFVCKWMVIANAGSHTRVTIWRMF